MCEPGCLDATVGVHRDESESTSVGCSLAAALADTRAIASCRHRHAIGGHQRGRVARRPEHDHATRVPPGRSAARRPRGTGRWVVTPSPARARDGYTLTRLTDGTVLLAGDYDFESDATSELYEPGRGS